MTNLASILLGMIGPWQIVLLVVMILLLFGGRKIPELMRGLGSGIKEFKGAVKEEDEEDSSARSNPSSQEKSSSQGSASSPSSSSQSSKN